MKTEAQMQGKKGKRYFYFINPFTEAIKPSPTNS